MFIQAETGTFWFFYLNWIYKNLLFSALNHHPGALIYYDILQRTPENKFYLYQGA